MAKIRVMCSDPFATDSSSDDEPVEDGNTPPTRKQKLFVREISAPISPSTPTPTVHLDYIAKLKSDSSSGKDEAKSEEDEKVPRGCVVLALPALKPGEIPRKKPGISRVQNILKKLSLAKKLSSGNCANQIAKSRRKVKSEHPGLRLTSNGRWGVKIRHPLRKTQVWLGTYDTFDEASKIFREKKLEFASMRCAHPNQEKQNPPVEKIRKERKRKRLVVEGVTVLETPSGKWGAFIKHPIERRKLWLGSYPTPEETVKAYTRRKLEFDSPEDSSMQVDQGSIKEDSSVKVNQGSIKEDSSVHVNQGSIKEDSSVQVNQGSIKEDSSIKVNQGSIKEDSSVQVNQGSIKEDSSIRVNQASIKEDSSMQVNQGGIKEGSSMQIGAKRIPIKSKRFASGFITNHGRIKEDSRMRVDAGTPVKSRKLNCTGVKLDASGKWDVTIQHPIRKCILHLGSYSTFEQATEAYDKRKMELDALNQKVQAACLAAEMAEKEEKEGKEAQCQTEIGVERKYKGVRAQSAGRWSAQINDPFAPKEKVYLGVFNTPEEAAAAFKRKRREFDVMRTLVKRRKQEVNAKIVKKVKPKYKKLDAIDAENSSLTVVNSQDSGGSNNKNGDNQTRPYLAPSEDLCKGVIDSYGQLVGEYSRIDDELWFDRPGGDEAAYEDSVWEQKPSPDMLVNAGILWNDNKAGII